MSESANRLFNLALTRAMDSAGQQGWALLSRPMRKNFVAQEVLGILSGQDESVSDARVRYLLTAINSLLEATEL